MSNSAPYKPHFYNLGFHNKYVSLEVKDKFIQGDTTGIFWTWHYEPFDYKPDVDDNFKEVVVEYCYDNGTTTTGWIEYYRGVGEAYDPGGYNKPGFYAVVEVPRESEVPAGYIKEHPTYGYYFSIDLRLKAYDTLGAESDYSTASNAYIYLKEWSANSAPTTPSSISVPSTIKGGDTVSISWGTATDEDGNLEGYVLERSTNGGTSWTEIYNGPSTATTNLVTYGLTSVIYRVKAYDSEGAESEYQSSSVVSVINNTAPKISGSDSNLGTKVFAFLQSYTVTDDEGGTVTVVEKIDGVTTKSYSVTLGNSNVFSFTDSQWQKLSNGSHSMTVTATDSYGASVTRTYTFTKSETEIELTYTTAITATTMPTVGVYYITKEIPSGASFSVRVCNNAFDSSPTWEDVTSAVNNGGRFYFNNTSKTASKWGVNAEIKVSRNHASGDCYISSVRGYFK